MVGFTVKIEGLRELDAKLLDLGGDAAKRVVNAGLRAGANVFQTAVQHAAPERVDTPSGTALPPGALAADIVIVRGRDETGLPAAIVGPGKYTAHVARWVEYGHQLVRGGRLGKGGRVVGEVEAHPFIRPAYEASAEAAISAFVQAAKEALEKETARAGGSR